MSVVKTLRVRLSLVLILSAASLVLWSSPLTSSACENCVFPDPGSGICVGCMQGDGFRNCEPDQGSCSCTVSGGTCRVGGYGT
jgi:hypothetical protein